MEAVPELDLASVKASLTEAHRPSSARPVAREKDKATPRRSASARDRTAGDAPSAEAEEDKSAREKGDAAREDRKEEDAKLAAPSNDDDEEEDDEEDDDDSDDDVEEEEEWVAAVNDADGDEEAMRQLYALDRTTFYVHGPNILKMLEYRRRHLADASPRASHA